MASSRTTSSRAFAWLGPSPARACAVKRCRSSQKRDCERADSVSSMSAAHFWLAASVSTCLRRLGGGGGTFVLPAGSAGGASTRCV